MTSEMQVILTNFKNRKRVHKDKLIHLPRLYNRLSKVHRLRRLEFDNAFLELDKQGYGLVERAQDGHLLAFLPGIPLPLIGKELLDKEPKTVPVKAVQTGKVVVLFKLEGKSCKAEIPQDMVDEFERRVK